MCTIGGVIVDTWNASCTHLIMNNIVVTVKVISLCLFVVLRMMLMLFRSLMLCQA